MPNLESQKAALMKPATLRRVDFCLALLTMITLGGGTWAVLAWVEGMLLAGAQGMAAFGVVIIMMIPKFIATGVAGAFGIALGCALSAKLFPVQE